MNRRELATSGFLGLCGILLGWKKKPFVYEGNTADPCLTGPVSLSWGTSSNVTYHTYCVPAGSTDIPPGWGFLNDPTEDIYSLSDGTEIQHG